MNGAWGRRLIRVGAVTAVGLGLLTVATASPVTAEGSGAEPGALRAASRSLSAGFGSTCVIITGGDLTCWGDDFEGVNGNGAVTGTITTPPIPMELPDGARAVSVVAASSHGCVVLDTGQVSCWGSGLGGRLGTGAETNLDAPGAPITLPAGRTAVDVVARRGVTCALLDDGGISCWGDAGDGQLGIGPASPGQIRLTPSAPISLPGGRTAIDVSVGLRHSCAVLDDGNVSCWGTSDAGALGVGSSGLVTRFSPSDPIALPAGRTAVAISLGDDHSCALLDDGDVSCWGSDDAGQLGNGSSGSTAAPGGAVQLPAGRRAVAIGAGQEHSCALLDDGTVSCWGADDRGQLGDDAALAAIESPSPPISIPGGPAVAIDAGADHTCVMGSGLEVFCWGDGQYGQLGNGGLDIVRVPPADPVALAPRPDAIAAGQGATCALLDGSTMSCWGDAELGRLANGSTADTNVNAPDGSVGFPGNRGATTIDLEDAHGCAVLDDGQIACWGSNGRGQLGDGTTVDRGVPVLVNGLNGTAVDVAVGLRHTCALLDNGAILCWGDNSVGQLGDPSAGASRSTPGGLGAGSLDTAVAIDAGSDFTCMLMASGNVECWGEGASGQMGDGSFADNAVPSRVSSLGGVAVEVAVGEFHACALLANGSARCWGSGGRGEIGDGNGISRNTPTAVDDSGFTGRFVSLAAGGFTTCGLLDGSRVACWGSNTQGGLGNGSPNSGAASPSSLVALSGRAVAVTVGGSHSCALLFTGAVECWGSGENGELGVGSPAPASANSPVAVDGNPLRLRVTAEVSAGTPGIPSAVSFQPSDDAGNVLVSWTAASSDGGSAITGYRIQESTDGGTTWTDVATVGATTRFDGTPNAGIGDSTQFRVAAVNAIGVSPFSRSSSAAVLDSVPGAPRNVRFTPRDGAIVVTWDPPLPNGGSPVTGYLVLGLVSGSLVGCGANAPETTCTIDGLTNGSVVETAGMSAVNDVGVGTPVAADAPFVVQPTPIITLQPARLYDSRADGDTVDDVQRRSGRVTAGSTTRIIVAERASVPADAAGAVLNITAVQPTTPGFFTIFPCDEEQPGSSTLNYVVGANQANGSTVALDGDGDVCIFSSGETHLLVDVTGFLPAGSTVTTVAPARLYESRPGNPTKDGLQQGTGRRAARSTTRVEIAGRAGIPNGAAGAVVNLTVVRPDRNGFLTVFPCDQDQPGSSTMNYTANQNLANGATVALDAAGDICVFTSATTDLIVDVTAHVPTTSTLVTLSPGRLLDTRPGESTVDGLGRGAGLRPAGSVTAVQVAGRHGVPDDAVGANLNIAAVQPEGRGFLTVFPCDEPQPEASTLNFRAGQNLANGATIKLADAGDVCIFTSARTQLIVDVSAYIPA